MTDTGYIFILQYLQVGDREKFVSSIVMHLQ